MTEQERQQLVDEVTNQVIQRFKADHVLRRKIERVMYISGKEDAIGQFIWTELHETYHISPAYYEGMRYLSAIVIHMLKYGDNRNDAIIAVAANYGKNPSQVKYQCKTALAFAREKGFVTPNQQKMVKVMYEEAVREFCLGSWV